MGHTTDLSPARLIEVPVPSLEMDYISLIALML